MDGLVANLRAVGLPDPYEGRALHLMDLSATVTLNLIYGQSCVLSDFELQYLAEKVHVHRWPLDSPVWDDSVRGLMDESVNNNPQKKQIGIRGNLLKIEDFEFDSLKKIGVTIPFFKKECTMILEAKYGKLSAHIHITVKSKDHVEIFNKLLPWSQGMH